VTVVGHQCITLTVDICVQHSGREAPRRIGLSAAAVTLYFSTITQKLRMNTHEIFERDKEQ